MPADRPVPMLSIVGPSGTGKTTLIEAIVAELSARGLQVAAVKHDAHRIELDTEGKDSWRMRKAGADALLVGDNQVAWMSEDGHAPPLADLVALFFAHSDLVIVEGYRSAGLPAIIVERPETADESWLAPSGEVMATVHPDQVSEVVELITTKFSL